MEPEQGQRAHARRELAWFVAVAVALPLLAALIRLRLQLLAHLRGQDLIQDDLQQAAQLAISSKQALQGFTV